MQEANVLEFGKALLNDPSSVEILPGDLDSWTLLPNTPFLLIDGNLGIPQKPLYGLYILAISMFTSSRRGTQKDAEDLNRLTAVLLLANPAHQTAANYRKRMIIQGSLSARKELAFLGLLQANKSHAKESILWSHRQWLLRHLGLTTSGENDTLDVFRNEFAIIYRAAEIYPRNYYAWNHWRFCIDALVTHLSEPQSDPFAQVLLEQYHKLTRWLEQHVSDYSAAHHLAGLVSLIQTFSTPAHDLPSQVDPQAAFDFAMSLSTFFSSHVTLRMFVETLIKIELDEGRKNQMRIRFGELVKSIQLDPSTCV